MSRRHRVLQKRAAGPRGKIEVPVKVKKREGRIDAVTQKKAFEIQRRCSPESIFWCLKKLQNSDKPIKILKVPKRCIEQAKKIKRKNRFRNIKIVNLTSKDY